MMLHGVGEGAAPKAMLAIAAPMKIANPAEECFLRAISFSRLFTTILYNLALICEDAKLCVLSPASPPKNTLPWLHCARLARIGECRLAVAIERPQQTADCWLRSAWAALLATSCA
jgi:hypothetical protein